MRVYGIAQRGGECGPIAAYNLARLLRTGGEVGGYRANRARLVEATGYVPRHGCGLDKLWRACRAELVGTPHKLIRRRNFWTNLVLQLDRAPSPAILVAVWDQPNAGKEAAHVAVLWRPFGRLVVLGANCAKEDTITPLWIWECGSYWPTSVAPQIMHPGSKLLGLWQAVPRR